MKNVREFVLPLPLLLALACEPSIPKDSVRPMFSSEAECERAGYSDSVCDSYEVEGRRYYSSGWVPVSQYAARPGVMGIMNHTGAYSTNPSEYAAPAGARSFAVTSSGATGKAPAGVVRGGFGSSHSGGYSS